MMKNPLPNNKNPKSEREIKTAVVNTLLQRINVQDGLCSSLTSHYRR
jgi:hypothetical protein